MNLNSIYRGPNAVDAPRLVCTAQPGAEPLTLTEAKLWLRVDQASEDALITDLITAARQHFEAITGICCVTQGWTLNYSQAPARFGEYGMAFGLAPGMSLTQFTGAPNGREIVIPRAPLIAVSAIQTRDGSGNLSTFSAANYTLGSVGSRTSFGRIWLNDGCDWPDLGNYPDAIQIAFTAGFGTDPTTAAFPRDVKMPIRWLLAHYYENRLPAATGDSLGELPFSLRALIENYRVAFLA